MSSEVQPGVHSTFMPVPQPLEAYDAQAKHLFPWRSFINRFVTVCNCVSVSHVSIKGFLMHSCIAAMLPSNSLEVMVAACW